MPRLEVPPLTFSSTEKGVEFLTKDQVTTLIDKLQQSHSAVLTETLKGPQTEVSRLETALKDAQKHAPKLQEIEQKYATLLATVERREVAQGLGLTDPEQAEELHAIFQGRMSAVDPAARPTFKAWAEEGLADPSKAPALTRSIFEAAAAARAADAGAGGGAAGGSGGTGAGAGAGETKKPPVVLPGRQTGGPKSKVSPEDIAKAGGDRKKLGEVYEAWKKETGRA
jgi:hypothetical protein